MCHCQTDGTNLWKYEERMKEGNSVSERRNEETKNIFEMEEHETVIAIRADTNYLTEPRGNKCACHKNL